MRSRLAVGCAVTLLVFAASRCGGGDSGNPNQPSPPPSGGGGGGGAASTITIVGDRGAQSFNPNPSSVGQGQTLSFRNTDNQVHRIVFNDNSYDSGNINPGATSDARAVPTNGANYHCSLHPGMIGAISGSSGQPPPCTGIYC